MVRPIVVSRCALSALALAGASSAALAGAAHAATLGLDQRCYVAGEKASLSGSGFSPRVPMTITEGTDPVPNIVADNSGAFLSTIVVPPVAAGAVESQVPVVATDGVTTANAYMNVTTASANFAPSVGDPHTLRVSHSISGFGLAETKPSIYLHYVSPAAQIAAAAKPVKPTTSTGGTSTSNDPPGVKSIRLGQLRGPCGVLRTSPRKLFPFKAEPGQWLLQYDTLPHYVHGTSASSFLWVARKLTIKP